MEANEKSLRKEQQPPLVKRQNEETLHTPTSQSKRRRIEKEEENSENDSNASENDSNSSENDSNISENETIHFNNQENTYKTGEKSEKKGIAPENKVGKRRIKIVPMMANVVKEEISAADVKPMRTLINYFVCPICDEKDGPVFRSEEISKVRKHIVTEHKYSEEKQVQTGLSIPNVPMYAII